MCTRGCCPTGAFGDDLTLEATKIQRAYRDYLSRSPEGKMADIHASSDPEDIQAMHERDIELMTAEIDRSRLAKIALKKTIVKKSKRITALTKEVCDARNHPITEMIYAELLQRFPGIPRGFHPVIRFHPSIDVAYKVGANRGARAIRSAIEKGLEEYGCHRRNVVFKGIRRGYLAEVGDYRFEIVGDGDDNDVFNFEAIWEGA